MPGPKITDSGKRGYDGDDSDKPAKKQKKLTKHEQLEEDLQQKATILGEALADLKTTLTSYTLEDKEASDFIRLLLKFCDDVKCGKHQRNATQAELLEFPLQLLEENDLAKLNPRQRVGYRTDVAQVNQRLENVAKLYKELLEDETYPPSASEYAKAKTWPQWQQKSTAILNLRPSDKQGLPLSILHCIFSRFYVTVQQEPQTSMALHTAYNLCIEMANSFENEKARRDAFETCIKPFFPGYRFEHEAMVESKLERHDSRVDLLISLNERRVLGGENKHDLGSGDAYMQISRVYQTWINQLKDDKSVMLRHGAPMILTCLMGPLLIVAGGFFDGESVVIEPLVEPCLMLPDCNHRRQKQLARVLAATKEAMESLSQLDYSAEVTFKPNVPRVYSSFMDFDDQAISLTFKSRLVLSKDPQSKHLFLATSYEPPQQLLVKLIAGDHYGTDAHRAVAKAGYAPTLFGVSKVEGALTAYIMEYLSPADGWHTLHDYAKQHQDVKSRIKNQVDKLLEVMSEKGIVHGDLRPNNITIRYGQGDAEPQLRVVDFDWAGVSGEVKYPLRRNEGIPWPAGPGEPIIDGHDKTLLMACLSQIGQ